MFSRLSPVYWGNEMRILGINCLNHDAAVSVIENGKIFVATNNSSIIIAEVYNLKNKKINSAIKVGHRFYTPTKFLDHALSTRANYKIIESTEAKTRSLKKT